MPKTTNADIVLYYDDKAHPRSRLYRRFGLTVLIWGGFITIGTIGNATDINSGSVALLTFGILLLVLWVTAFVLTARNAESLRIRVDSLGIHTESHDGAVHNFRPAYELLRLEEPSRKSQNYLVTVRTTAGKLAFAPASTADFRLTITHMIDDQNLLELPDAVLEPANSEILSESDGASEMRTRIRIVRTIVVALVVLCSIGLIWLADELPVLGNSPKFHMIALASIVSSLIVGAFWLVVRHAPVDFGELSVSADTVLLKCSDGTYFQEIDISRIKQASTRRILAGHRVVNLDMLAGKPILLPSSDPESLAATIEFLRPRHEPAAG